jgi:Leucine Rich repeat
LHTTQLQPKFQKPKLYFCCNGFVCVPQRLCYPSGKAAVELMKHNAYTRKVRAWGFAAITAIDKNNPELVLQAYAAPFADVNHQTGYTYGDYAWIECMASFAGDTALHLAVKWDKRAAFDVLLSLNASWTITNAAGETVESLVQQRWGVSIDALKVMQLLEYENKYMLREELHSRAAWQLEAFLTKEAKAARTLALYEQRTIGCETEARTLLAHLRILAPEHVAYSKRHVSAAEAQERSAMCAALRAMRDEAAPQAVYKLSPQLPPAAVLTAQPAEKLPISSRTVRQRPVRNPNRMADRVRKRLGLGSATGTSSGSVQGAVGLDVAAHEVAPATAVPQAISEPKLTLAAYAALRSGAVEEKAGLFDTGDAPVQTANHSNRSSNSSSSSSRTSTTALAKLPQGISDLCKRLHARPDQCSESLSALHELKYDGALTAASAAALAAAVQSSHQLRELNLSHKHIGDAEVLLLLKALCCSSGSSNSSSDSSSSAKQDLRYLNLEHNDITDVGGRAIAAAIAQQQLRISKLCLRNNKLSAAVAQSLLAAAQSQGVWLSVSSCEANPQIAMLSRAQAA